MNKLYCLKTSQNSKCHLNQLEQQEDIYKNPNHALMHNQDHGFP